jgi:polyisoprenoid-binding protein YceI
MKKTLTPLLMAALLALSGTTALAQAKLTPVGSAISFTSKQMGVNVEGNFKKFDAAVNFDPKKLADAKIGFTIDLTSVDIGDAGTMAELKKPGWFDSAKVPTANFASTSVKSLGGNKFEIAGNLTIKGIVKPVVAPVTLTQSAGATRAEGVFTIKRLDYKIGDGDWNDVSLVANDVQVKLRLNFSGIPAL